MSSSSFVGLVVLESVVRSIVMRAAMAGILSVAMAPSIINATQPESSNGDVGQGARISVVPAMNIVGRLSVTKAEMTQAVSIYSLSMTGAEKSNMS